MIYKFELSLVKNLTFDTRMKNHCENSHCEIYVAEGIFKRMNQRYPHSYFGVS